MDGGVGESGAWRAHDPDVIGGTGGRNENLGDYYAAELLGSGNVGIRRWRAILTERRADASGAGSVCALKENTLWNGRGEERAHFGGKRDFGECFETRVAANKTIAGEQSDTDTFGDSREISLDQDLRAKQEGALLIVSKFFVAIVSRLGKIVSGVPARTGDDFEFGMGLREAVGKLIGEPDAEWGGNIVGKSEIEEERFLFTGSEELESQALGERGYLMGLFGRGGKKLLGGALNAERRGRPQEEK